MSSSSSSSSSSSKIESGLASSRPLTSRPARQQRSKTRIFAVASTTRAALTALMFCAVCSLICSAVFLVESIRSGFGSAAFFRATPLISATIFAATCVSVYVDEESVDMFTALLVGVLAVLAHVPVIFCETMRIVGASSQIEHLVVTQSPDFEYSVPVLAFVFAAFAVVQFILLVFLMVRRRDFRAFAAVRRLDISRYSSVRRARGNDVSRDRQIVDTRIKEFSRRIELNKLTRQSSLGRVNLVLLVVHAIVLYGISLLSILNPGSAAFYRGWYLTPAALFVGLDLAFFGATPSFWVPLTAIAALFAAVFAGIGAVFEVTRFFECAVTSLAPQSAVDNEICLFTPILGAIMPWLLVIVTFVSLVQLYAIASGGTRRTTREQL